MSDPEQYHLQWRGQSYGPWDLPAIRQALSTGSIHSLYQIHAGGRWQPLRDFLENLPRIAPVTRHAVEETPRMQPAEAAAQPVQEQAAPAQQPPVRLPGQPPPLPPHLPPPVLGAPPLPPSPASPFLHPPPHAHESRISGMAIASFVLSLCFLIPYVNLITSLLSLVFGHIALGQTDSDASLRGRGLALAGLIISYGVIAFVVISGLAVVIFSQQ